MWSSRDNKMISGPPSLYRYRAERGESRKTKTQAQTTKIEMEIMLPSGAKPKPADDVKPAAYASLSVNQSGSVGGQGEQIVIEQLLSSWRG